MDRQYEVKVTQHAEQAIREIVRYITFDLLAPEAATKLMMTLNHLIYSELFTDTR